MRNKLKRFVIAVAIIPLFAGCAMVKYEGPECKGFAVSLGMDSVIIGEDAATSGSLSIASPGVCITKGDVATEKNAMTVIDVAGKVLTAVATIGGLLL